MAFEIGVKGKTKNKTQMTQTIFNHLLSIHLFQLLPLVYFAL